MVPKGVIGVSIIEDLVKYPEIPITSKYYYRQFLFVITNGFYHLKDPNK